MGGGQGTGELEQGHMGNSIGSRTHGKWSAHIGIHTQIRTRIQCHGNRAKDQKDMGIDKRKCYKQRNTGKSKGTGTRIQRKGTRTYWEKYKESNSKVHWQGHIKGALGKGHRDNDSRVGMRVNK